MIQTKVNNVGNDENDPLGVKNIIITAAVFCLLATVVGSFFIDWKKMLCGTVFGFVISLLCFRLLYIDTQRALGAGSKAKKMAGFSYTKRLLIKGAALYACTVNDTISFAGCAVALVSISIAIHILNIILIIKSRKRG